MVNKQYGSKRCNIKVNPKGTPNSSWNLNTKTYGNLEFKHNSASIATINIPVSRLVQFGAYYTASRLTNLKPQDNTVITLGSQSQVHNNGSAGVIKFNVDLSKSVDGASASICSVKGFRYWLSSGYYSTAFNTTKSLSSIGYGSVSYRPKTRSVTHYSRGPIAKKKFSLVPVGFWRKPSVGSLYLSRGLLSTPINSKDSMSEVNKNLAYISGLVSKAGGSAAKCSKITSFLPNI